MKNDNVKCKNICKLFKSLSVILIFTLYILNFPSSISAHFIGQSPFLKINGQYANLYPVPLTSLNNFDLPQDLASDNYLLKQSINFELNTGRLPAPPEIVAKTKFDWDFADGTHAQSLKNTHTFSKIGSYIVKIYADDGTTPKPQLLESVLVNVLPASPTGGPDKNYQLPKAVIKVNGQQSRDPLTDILQFNFQDKLQFECSKSDCFWDFGDQKSGFGPTQTHEYPSDLSQVFVVLRVKDENGFIADNFVEIQNSLNRQNNIATYSAKPAASPKKSSLSITIIAIIIFITLLAMVHLWLRGPRHGKHQ